MANNELSMSSNYKPIIETDPLTASYRQGVKDGQDLSRQLRSQDPHGLPSSVLSRAIAGCQTEERLPEGVAYIDGVQMGHLLDTLDWNVEVQGGNQ